MGGGFFFRSEQSEKEVLERERGNLIEKAIRCQETILKLRLIYSKFKKDDELVRLIYGDLSFATMLKMANKAGQLEKQGGANVKKWEPRQFILNDSFLLYYGSKSDKTPKGIIRMDHSRAEKSDLSRSGLLRLKNNSLNKTFFFFFFF